MPVPQLFFPSTAIDSVHPISFLSSRASSVSRALLIPDSMASSMLRLLIRLSSVSSAAVTTAMLAPMSDFFSDPAPSATAMIT